MQEKQGTAQVFPFLQGLFQHESVLQVSAARQVDALPTQKNPQLLKYQTLIAHPLLLGSVIQTLQLSVLKNFFSNPSHFPNFC